jgi:predicted nucleic acid-binding protein
LKIVDTVVLVSSNDPTHPLYPVAQQHLLSLSSIADFFVPTIVLVEYDLELKTHGFSVSDREKIFRALEILIPRNKIIPCTHSVHASAPSLERFGGYFDSLIAATALEYAATIVSTDSVFDRMGIPRIW